MADVTLIEFTGKGRPDEEWHAANLLIFTKSTRLSMSPDLFDEIQGWTEDRKREELAYMANTIPSSWEFVDLTFLIRGVTRATAQQITRTRTASYAMQSQRVTNVMEAPVHNPFTWEDFAEQSRERIFDSAVKMAKHAYNNLVDRGAKLEDARGILPLNTECNLVAKYNLRSFIDLLRARSSLRVQGEYVDIADQMRAAMLGAWPWAEPFTRHPLDAALGILEDVARELGLNVGSGPSWQIAKAIDLIRKHS